jgi:hypothetical protein
MGRRRPGAGRPGRSPATLDLLQIQPAPAEAVLTDPEDGDAPHLQAGPIAAGAVPVPLGPPAVAHLGRAEQLGPEVGHAGKDLGPVAADLVGADKARSGCTGCWLW